MDHYQKFIFFFLITVNQMCSHRCHFWFPLTLDIFLFLLWGQKTLTFGLFFSGLDDVTGLLLRGTTLITSPLLSLTACLPGLLWIEPGSRGSPHTQQGPESNERFEQQGSEDVSSALLSPCQRQWDVWADSNAGHVSQGKTASSVTDNLGNFWIFFLGHTNQRSRPVLWDCKRNFVLFWTWRFLFWPNNRFLFLQKISKDFYFHNTLPFLQVLVILI